MSELPMHFPHPSPLPQAGEEADGAQSIPSPVYGRGLGEGKNH